MVKKIQLEILCQKGVHHSMKLKDEVALSLMQSMVQPVTIMASSRTVANN